MVNKITWKHVCYGLVILCVFAFLICLTSCSTTRKDQKALTRVLGTPELAEKAFKELEKSHPCLPAKGDTTFLEGRIDSIPYPLPTIDEIGNKRYKDSLTKALAAKYQTNIADCNRQVNEAFDVGYQKARDELSQTKVPDKKPDTLKIREPDIRRLNLVLAELNEKKGRIELLESDRDKANKKASTRLWIIIGICALWLGLAIYSFIKHKKQKLL